jgi:two-component system chemotaxis response regulator CheY
MAKKILIVDDSNTIRQQVSFTLTKGGYEVVEADNGLNGIQKLKEQPDIALIISDINMPEMNGFEMLHAINTSEELQHPPILILTTEGSNEAVAEAKKLGARGWIIKPFKPDALIEGIRKLIG